MSPALVLSVTASVIALFTAIFHGWLYALRPKDRSNLWLLLIATSCASCALITGFLYESHDVEQSILLQRLLVVACSPILFGLYQYSFAYLGVDEPRTLRVVSAFLLVWCVLAVWPGAIFTGEPVEHRVDILDTVYIGSKLSALGQAIIPVFLLATGYLIYKYVRLLDSNDENRFTLCVMLSAWVATAINDTLVGLDVYEGPILISLGHTAFVAGFSAIEVRRMVASMVAEQRHERILHELVEERTAELRDTELRLAHGEQMATIGTLAASVAHEINNPIAYALSNLNHIEQYWSIDEESEEVSSMLRDCEEGIDRIRTIISSLLTIARRSDGVDQPVDLRDLVTTSLPIIQREATYRARLETHLEPIPLVSGDPRLLGHVIFSLVMSALQAIPEGTPLTNRIAIGTREQDGFVVLDITDSRPLVAESQPAEIETASGKSRDRRASFGLSVTKKLIHRHGGEIRTESGESGTSVIVQLPAL